MDKLAVAPERAGAGNERSAQMPEPGPFDALVPPPPPAGREPHAELLAMPMVALAAAISSGKLSSRELTAACLARIDELDRPAALNAFLLHRGEQVLAEAAHLDDLQAKGTVVGPLHGIPLGIKDGLATAGVPTTGGTALLRDWVPERDATAVHLLKGAGALVLGKTNMHEIGLGITSNNPHYGAVRNPYDPSRIPGGSSGGSGAAVAARLCPAAIGTDTGGSVRIPAALCGVVGLKPTLGRVGRGGMLGLSWSFDVIGPITRTVADAAALLRVLSVGPDPRDPYARHDPTGRTLAAPTVDDHRALRGLRIGVPEGYFAEDNTPDVDRVLGEAYERLRTAGVELVPVTVADVEVAIETGFLTVVPEGVVLAENMLTEAGIAGGLAGSLAAFGPDVRAAIEGQIGPAATPVSGHQYARALAETVPAIRRGFMAALDGVDALLTPATPATAVPIDEHVEMRHNGRTVDTFATFIRYTFPVSVAGLPAISVPGGVGTDGLPVGLQLIGTPWSEARLIEIALAFERLGAG
ncbi:MAG: aspartyl-tRNA(Asn)/glutamyl-tRNA(Gln) amidotransferase subunit [Pseudonocardiales bacterium]|nr:aspartyl-tRNA(Asn)/glutamyl-tRNA(Gln) amidotransferase subunit [Pseudonocardiales bacterium]